MKQPSVYPEPSAVNEINRVLLRIVSLDVWQVALMIWFGDGDVGNGACQLKTQQCIFVFVLVCMYIHFSK